MAVIQKEITVAAGASVENALAGSAFEFARSNQLVSIGVLPSTTGGFVTIQAGGTIVLEESPVGPPIGGARFPVIPDEMYYNDVAALGDRLVVRLRNTNAGANAFRLIVQVSNL